MAAPYNPGGPAANVVLIDGATGLPYVASGSSAATGPGTAATATRVTYASDGASVPVIGTNSYGDAASASLPGLNVNSFNRVFNGSTYDRMRGDTTGTWVVQGGLPAGTNRSGTATTTSGGLNVAANASRRSLVGQNISAVSIGFNEFGGTAAIGTAGTYTVPAGASFSISTTGLVNFVAASGTAAVTMTET